MVDAGAAAIHSVNGKVKAVRLLAAAATHAERIGEPTIGGVFGTRFTRRVRSDLGVSWIEHHPRCTQE